LLCFINASDGFPNSMSAAVRSTRLLEFMQRAAPYAAAFGAGLLVAHLLKQKAE
jgi:hypothetical protein